MTTTDNGVVDEAASTSSSAAPAQRPPHLWIMWANVALSWSGLALLYLMFLTFKNIRWARRNSQPWFRYAAPLATLASAIVVLGILGSLITSSDLRNPAQATPLGSSASTNNAVSTSFVASDADAKIPLAERLKTSDGLPVANPMVGSATDRIDTILAGFNAAWKASCTGSDQKPEPRYLWSFVQDVKGPFYAKWAIQSPSICGSFALVNEPTVTADPQAAAGVTSRWYLVKDSLVGSSEQGAELPMLIRFIDNRWMMVGLSPKGTSLASSETGQSIKNDPVKVVAQMVALREQAFMQRSPDLLAVYYDGQISTNSYIDELKLIDKGIVPIITVQTITTPPVAGMVTVESSEKQGDKTVHRSTSYNWFPAPMEQGIPNVWAENA